MYVSELWRYPVKSMAGELVQSAHLTASGIDGDRVIQVKDARGRTATSRTYPKLLGLHATIDPQGMVLVDGKPWTDRSVLTAVQDIVGPEAKLVEDHSVNRFDILPLLVATDGAIAVFGRDRRRIRPNIIVGGVDGLEERTWEGAELTIGEVVVGIHDLRGRCIMTTFDPDTLKYDPAVMRDIVKRFGGRLALNCEVLAGGTIQVGQEVKLEK
ncbi:MAG: MOSC N-terminal beta barrel domain-containing protein [Acidobacteriota bacterium]